MQVTRHPRKHLRAQFVKHISKQGRYCDGYYLLVKPNGTKFWVQPLTFQGKRKELELGSVDFVSLAQARGKAIENYKVARTGEEPPKKIEQTESVAKTVLDDVPTFEQATQIVHEINDQSWTGKHAAQFITTLLTLPRIYPQFNCKLVCVFV